jgi:hypothetical protein
MQQRTDIVTNVNRLGQSVSELHTVILRTNSKATDNTDLAKKRGFLATMTMKW